MKRVEQRLDEERYRRSTFRETRRMGHAAAEGQTIAIEIGRQAADGIAAPPQERLRIVTIASR